MVRLRWRAGGRRRPKLYFGVLPALVVMLQRTPKELLRLLVVFLSQKQKSLILQFSGTFASTLWCCSARVLRVLPLP